jgi:hypothetical protein
MVGNHYRVIDALANICTLLGHRILDGGAIRDVDACELEDFIVS